MVLLEFCLIFLHGMVVISNARRNRSRKSFYLLHSNHSEDKAGACKGIRAEINNSC